MALLGLPVVWPRPARADWLLWLPECALDTGGPPRFGLEYPAPGLPAVVAAGAPLIARVRLPAGLTPPPGVQQAAALRPWSAVLWGEAPGVLGASDAPLRYPLEAVDVRPDGASSLVYRVTLPVPAWVAPGVYGLSLRGPGGKGRSPAAVVVHDPGEFPAVRRAPAGDALWIGRHAPAGQLPGLSLVTTPYALLATPRGVLELAADRACQDRWAETRAHLVRAHGPRVVGPSSWPRAEGPPPRITAALGAGRVRLRTPTLGAFRGTLPVTVGGYRVSGAARHRFFPAGAWHGRLPERLVLWAELSPGRPLLVTRRRAAQAAHGSGTSGTSDTPAATGLSLAAPGAVQRVRVGYGHRPWATPERASDPPASLAPRWAVRLSDRTSYFGVGPPPIRPLRTGPQLVPALRISRHGQVELARARLVAGPRAAVCSPAGPRKGRPGALVPFLLALALLNRRRTSGSAENARSAPAGNTIGRHRG